MGLSSFRVRVPLDDLRCGDRGRHGRLLPFALTGLLVRSWSVMLQSESRQWADIAVGRPLYYGPPVRGPVCRSAPGRL